MGRVQGKRRVREGLRELRVGRALGELSVRALGRALREGGSEGAQSEAGSEGSSE